MSLLLESIWNSFIFFRLLLSSSTLSPLSLASWPTPIIYTVFAIVAYKLFRHLLMYRKISKITKNIPGPKKKFFLLGNLYMIKKRPNIEILTTFFECVCGFTKLYQKCSMIVFWIATKPFFVFYKVDSAEKIFSSTTHITKSIEYRFLTPWLGTGLLTSSGKKWFTRRKMLTPSFHFNILEAFLSSMNEQSNVLVEKIVAECERHKTKSVTIDVVPYITYAALDIICETAMGINLDSQHNPNNEYVLAIHRLGNKVIQRVLNPWLWNDFIYFNFSPNGREDRKDLASVHNFTDKVVHERKQATIKQLNAATSDASETAGIVSATTTTTTESNNNEESIFIQKRKRLAFLDMLIEQHLKNPQEFKLEDIREEVDTFMFEGHDTTAMSMIWTLFLLGHHPEVQQRVHKEIDDLWDRHQLDQSATFLTTNQLRELKYLEACIKESLRLFPSVPFIARIAETDIQLDQYTIPKGSTLFLLIEMIHCDAKLYEKPYSFIPERFVEGSQAYVRNPFAYVPFSAGPRNCIGQKFALQEEKVLLATVLRHFALQSVKHLDSLIIQPELVKRPKVPVEITFSLRK